VCNPLVDSRQLRLPTLVRFSAPRIRSRGVGCLRSAFFHGVEVTWKSSFKNSQSPCRAGQPSIGGSQVAWCRGPMHALLRILRPCPFEIE
jgi:hypothetical protein